MKEIVGTRVMDCQIWIAKLSNYHARRLTKKWYGNKCSVRNLSLLHWCNIYEWEFKVKLQPISGHTLPTDYIKLTKENASKVELLCGTPKNLN